MALVQKEFTDHELACQKIEQKMHLVTQKPLREGETVCALTGLAYDTVDRLRTFLNTDPEGVNTDFVSSLVRIDNVILGEDEKRGSLFFALTGVGRFLQHYAPLKKAPNCVLAVDTSVGVNDGLLSLVVRTRNKGGVAAGSPLVINYGMDYDHDAVGGECWAAEPEARKGLARHDV